MHKPSTFALLGLATLSVSASCRNQPNSSENTAPEAAPAPASVARPNASVPPPAPAVPLASGPHAAAEQAYPGQDQSVGKWVESSAYKFRVTDVVRCADPAPGETVPEDRKVRVGAFIQVFSKFDQFFLTPRDVTLEKGGVILDSERNAKPGPECKPLLEPMRVMHDQTRGGVVVFQVPDESFLKDGVVAFNPTRWGGAPRVEVKVAEVVAARAGAKK
jgi:hypothetical protein